jgi:polygalacturonase
MITAPLLLFANPPETLPPPDPTAPGVMYFGPGVHKLGYKDKIPSGTTIYIAGGAVVRGQLFAENASNITVRGRGILDSSLSPIEGPANEYGHTGRQTRWFKIRNLTIEGIILHDSPSWGIELAHCDNVQVRNVKVITSRGADGVDVCSSEHVVIADSFFRTHDDSINVKGLTDLAVGYPGDGKGGWSPAGNRKAARDITFTNLVLWNDRAHGMMVGPETRATVIEDVLFKDIDMIHALSASVIGLFSSDAAPMRRIRFENIQIEDARVFTLLEIRVSPAYTTADPECGPVDDVTFRNITVNTPTRLCSAIYADRNTIRNVRLENIFIYNKYARTFQDMPVFLRGQTTNITITVDVPGR